MARLFLVVLAIIAVLALFVAAGRMAGRATSATQEVSLPDTVKTISYILLIVLMFGVVTGWLGGL